MSNSDPDQGLSAGKTRYDRLFHFSLPETLPAEAVVTPAKTGRPTLVVTKRHIHSAFDPEKEAVRLVTPHAAATAGILFGYGCGHLALAWLQQGLRPLLVVECRPDLLPAGRATAKDLPVDAPIFFARAWEKNLLEEDIRRFARSQPAAALKSLAWLDTPGIVALDPPLWIQARSAVRGALTRHLTNLFTELEFERLWFSNILSNAALLPASERLADLAGTQAGRTVMIIGAGPGLDRWLPWLAEAREHAVLLAVDTALKPLTAAGVIPHAVISLDGQIHNLHDFTGIDTSEMTLFADISVHPAIPRLPFARRVFFETADIVETDGRPAIISHPLTLWCKQAVGEIGAARSGGNVGTSALELARILGASKILFVGCDHAWPGGLTHAREAPAMQRLRHKETRLMSASGVMRGAISRRAWIPGQDYHGRPVRSDIILSKYADWTVAAYREAVREAQDAGRPMPDWATLSSEGLVLDGIPALCGPAEASAYIGTGRIPTSVFPVTGTGISRQGAADLEARLRLLGEATSQLLTQARPLPPLEMVLDLFKRFPFLRRGYGAQVLHAEKTGNAEWLLGEVRFQLTRIRHILVREGFCNRPVSH
ncbi:MAG TPA: DUF115 domain-containing protein [Spirochaetota bacterium]|nr:DUF115 domain-containing protein [Spirochaetota bacterium]